MSEKHYDYFVIGAGSGGVRSARIAASLGARVGVAECKVVGGTCVNVGCVPKKLMAYAADYKEEFEDAEGYGWSVGKTAFDWDIFVKNKDKEIQRLNGIYGSVLEKNGVEYLHGRATFADENTLLVGDTQVCADTFLIATGSRPRRIGYPGEELTLTSDEMFHLKKLPDHLLIVGGGYIGVEFAHIFHGMGAKVTLVHRGPTLLRGFETDMAEALAEEMEKQGINLCLECDVAQVEKKGKVLRATLTDGCTIEADQVLSAIGRDPNTESLMLEKIGVETDERGYIKTGKDNKTTQGHIYALGDVASAFQLTPVAIAEGEALSRRLFGGEKDRYAELDNIPTAIFSRPPIATVGYSEQQALAEGKDVECFTSRFRPMKYTLAGRDEKTLMKLVVEKKSGKVLGCHMIGLEAPEIMQGFAVAIKMGATKADFDRTVGIHPTSAEEFVTMK